MEIAVGLIGLIGAGIGLVAACIPRRENVIHRHEAHLAGGPYPASPGKLVARSILFGLSIGLFFGIMMLGILMFWAEKAFSHPNHSRDYTSTVIFGLGLVVVFGLLGTFLGLRVGLKVAALSAQGHQPPTDTQSPPRNG